MGMAASQARLLMITARKDDVELNMQRISNDKLLLSRKSTEISENYANALNETKLVWETNMDTEADLTYDLLMRPNTGIDGQYMITNAYGQVMLDDEYANIFDSSGTKTSGNAGSVTCAQFVAANLGCTEEAAKTYEDSFSTGTPMVSDQINTSYDYQELWNYLADPANGLTYTGVTVDGEDKTYKYGTGEFGNNMDADHTVRFASNAAADRKGLTAVQLDTFVGQNCDNMAKALAAQLTLDDTNPSVFNQAIEQAKIATQTYYQSALAIDADTKYEDDAKSGVAGTTGVYESWNGTNTYFVDINQMMKLFLAYFDAACAGYNAMDTSAKGSPANSDKLAWINAGIKANGVAAAVLTGDPSFLLGMSALSNGVSTLINGGSNNEVDFASVPFDQDGDGKGGTSTVNSYVAAGDAEYAGFYIALYDAISANGWKRNSAIDKDDGSYLQNLVENGSAYIYELQEDGTWDLSSDGGGALKEVSDEVAIKKAEAEYDKANNEIEYKEKELDIKMNNLDTERAALDTELESVRKVIDKNIEQTFKLFQSG